jgi:hypothetical protein
MTYILPVVMTCMLGVGACKISSTYATHSRQLWLARNEILHSKTDKPQINIVRVVETAEIHQEFYQQPHKLRAGHGHYTSVLKRLLNGPPLSRQKMALLSQEVN